VDESNRLFGRYIGEKMREKNLLRERSGIFSFVKMTFRVESSRGI
jgi:hypothetical protein